MREKNMTIELFQQLLSKEQTEEKSFLTVLQSLTKLQSKSSLVGPSTKEPTIGAWGGWG